VLAELFTTRYLLVASLPEETHVEFSNQTAVTVNHVNVLPTFW